MSIPGKVTKLAHACAVLALSVSVISLATSGLTQRSEQFGAGDRDTVSGVASQLAAAINTPPRSESCKGYGAAARDR
jgi:hypothetical protein